MTTMTAPERVVHAPASREAPVQDLPHGVTAADRLAFHTDDRQAAAMVAGIMLAIFGAAIVMYTIIAWIAWGG